MAKNSGPGRGGRKYLLLFLLCLLAGGAVYMRYGLVFDAALVGPSEVDPADAVAIGFSRPVLLMDADSVRLSPDADYSYRLSEDRRTLVVTPAAGFAPETKYTLTLSGVRGQGGAPLAGKNIVFYTRMEAGAVRSAMDAELEEEFGEVSLSRDKYIAPENSVPAREVVISPHWTAGRYIDVSLAHQVMTLFEDGRPVNQLLVSTGRYGMPTPQGEFTVRRKEENHWSFQYKLWMPFSLNFSGPYYIHELPYWPSGYHEGAAHLGTKVSHGCVRLGIGPAEYVFDWAEVGTPIYIHE